MNSKSINGKLLLSAVALALGLGVASSASALLMVSATVGVTNACATDGNVACGFGTQIPDTNGAANTLALGSTTVPITIGGVDFLGSVAVSTFGDPDILNSTSLDIKNNNATAVTITIAIGATDFVLANTASTTGSGTFQASNGSTVTMKWYDDNENSQGAETSTDTPGLLLDTFSTAANSVLFSYSHNGGPFAVSDPNKYSMTETITFTLQPGGELISRGQAEIKSFVPEPATLALLGIALVGLGFSRRNKQV